MTFFHYIDNNEIEERAYEYLCSLCDCAEMLYAYRNEDADGLEIAAIGTEYEGLIPAITGVRRGKSWGMEGRIYKFALTDEFKRFLTRGGLSQMQRINGVWLENLTLYKGDKVLYSTCSHEGLLERDDEFIAKVSDFCRGEIVKTELYAETLERYKKLPPRTRNERAVIRSKLYDLEAQVEKAWNAYIRQVPQWDDLTYEEYLALAKPVFSSDVYEEFEKAGSFKGLYPYGYPDTIEATLAFSGRDVPQFTVLPLPRKIDSQLDMMNTVFFIEEGLDDWRVDGVDYNLGPSIIINGK